MFQLGAFQSDAFQSEEEFLAAIVQVLRLENINRFFDHTTYVDNNLDIFPPRIENTNHFYPAIVGVSIHVDPFRTIEYIRDLRNQGRLSEHEQ